MRTLVHGLSRWWHQLVGRARRQRDIPDALWARAIQRYPFLAARTSAELARLRVLSGEFLAQKEFHGAGGLEVSDQMAVDIAAQACLPLLHLRARPDRAEDRGDSPLAWYRDFVGVVVQPGEVVAHREATDEAGVVHHYDEVISGEAMDHGPVMLSWPDVAEAGATSAVGYNVVIHEFAHKIDMADGAADGCPALHEGFMGAASAAMARRLWAASWRPTFEGFCERVVVAERFGGERPWLDDYGAHSPEEFFAVACEAYFVNREMFAQEFATLLPLMDAFFRPELPAGDRAPALLAPGGHGGEPH